MTEPDRFRYRITFHKTEAMRFIGHLDLYRALERTVRRAGLPLAYRRGFSPHPRLQLASALPLGVTSRAELADLWLEQVTDEEEVFARLEGAAPPGLRFMEARRVIATEPALQQQVISATFDVALVEPGGEDLVGRVASLLSCPSILRQRRGKSYDLRPLVEDLKVLPPAALHMRLAAREAATGRPEEVLEALGLDPLDARIERTSLILASPEGRPSPGQA